MSIENIRRYARHIVLPEIGEKGQARLAACSVMVVGAGGLGASCLMSLAAAGIGRLGIVDYDRVELSNLPRQTLYETADIGSFKAKAAKDRLEELNPQIKIHEYIQRFEAENADQLLSVYNFPEYDLVIDGTDNFSSRYAINDACLRRKIPWIHAAILGYTAHIAAFCAHCGGDYSCYRCYIPEVPERELSCAQEGVISPLAAIAGNIQALEAMKILLNIGDNLFGKLLIIDALNMNFRKIKLLRDPECAHNQEE